MLQAGLGISLLVGAGFMAHYYAPPETASLQAEVSQLTEQVQELQQAQSMPTLVLNRYRDSICYVFGVYQVGFPGVPRRCGRVSPARDS